MIDMSNAQLARVKQLDQDLYKEGEGFANLMGVSDLRDPRFVAWMSEVGHVVSSNPKLLRADRASLFESLRSALTMGLSINPLMGEAYLIPRWNTKARCELVQCQTGWRGLKELMYRSEMIDSIHVDVVYRDEEFKYYSGSDPRIEHMPDFTGVLRTNKFEDIVCAYATILLKGSTRPIIRLVTSGDLADARGMNLDKDGNPSMPWREHAEAMCWKVALARATKSAPRSKGLAAVHDLLNEEYAKARVEQMDKPAAPTLPPPPDQDDEPTAWEIACEYYQGVGVSPEMILAFLKRKSVDDVTEENLQLLRAIYADARSGIEKAQQALGKMRGDEKTAEQERADEATATGEQERASEDAAAKARSDESIPDEEIPF